MYAEALRLVGRTAEALSIFDRLLLTNSRLIRSKVFLEKGAALYDKGRFAEAERAYRKSFRIQASAIPLVELAVSLIRRECFDEALKFLQKAVRCRREISDNVLADIHCETARCHRAMRRLTEAKAALEKALLLNPQAGDARAMLADIDAALRFQADMTCTESDPMEPAETIARYEAGAQLSRPLRIAKRYYAMALREAGLYTKSLEICDLLLERHLSRPLREPVQVFRQRGQILDEMRRFADAEAAFRQAVELENSTVSYVFLAGTLSMQERYEEAVEILRRALSLNLPGNPDEVWLNIGYNCRTLGRFKEAEEALQEALRLCSDYPEAEKTLKDVRAAMKYLNGHTEPIREDILDGHFKL